MYTQSELDALDDKEYRDSYVDGVVKASLAHQIRAVRQAKGLTQTEFAKLIDKPQSVVSRLEDTEYGQLTVQTLLNIARRLDISLIVAFASFSDFLAHYDDVSEGKLAVVDYASTKVHATAATVAEVGAPDMSATRANQGVLQISLGASKDVPVRIPSGGSTRNPPVRSDVAPKKRRR